MRRDWKDTAVESAAVLSDAVVEVAGGFGRLKAVLGAFLARYDGYEVRLDPSPKTLSRLTRLQEKVFTRNTIKHLLSRVTRLEVVFGTLPGDVGEARRRSELIRYATVSSFNRVLIPLQ